MPKKPTRGVRNNNPGNIRHSKDKWRGLAPVQTDTAFFVFLEAKWGVRALGKILLTYNRKYGLNTVRGLIDRWAPPVENDTNSYVAAVAKALIIAPDTEISVPTRLPALATAIIHHENGYNPYLPADIAQWVFLA